eukprot:6383424-Prorocentrum_lima.AAC.1
MGCQLPAGGSISSEKSSGVLLPDQNAVFVHMYGQRYWCTALLEHEKTVSASIQDLLGWSH